MKPILLTGGGGFLGTWIARLLAQDGRRVRVFDLFDRSAMRPGFADVAASAADAGEWIQGDVTDAQAVEQAASGCAGIIHLAALLTPACQRDPVRGAQVNLLGTLNVFAAARKHAIAQVAYASSAAVFGPPDGETAVETAADTAHGRCSLPTTHYGAFKLACESCARAFWLDAGIASVGIRPAIVYGPGRETGLTADITLACRHAATAAAAAKPYTIRFSGRQGFVFAQDAAAAFVAAATQPRTGAQAFSLVGQMADVTEVAQEIMAQAPGVRIAVDGPPVPMSAAITDTAFGALLPSTPLTSLHDGIARTLAHYRHG